MANAPQVKTAAPKASACETIEMECDPSSIPSGGRLLKVRITTTDKDAFDKAACDYKIAVSGLYRHGEATKRCLVGTVQSNRDLDIELVDVDPDAFGDVDVQIYECPKGQAIDVCDKTTQICTCDQSYLKYKSASPPLTIT